MRLLLDASPDEAAALVAELTPEQRDALRDLDSATLAGLGTDALRAAL